MYTKKTPCVYTLHVVYVTSMCKFQPTSASPAARQRMHLPANSPPPSPVLVARAFPFRARTGNPAASFAYVAFRPPPSVFFLVFAHAYYRSRIPVTVSCGRRIHSLVASIIDAPPPAPRQLDSSTAIAIARSPACIPFTNPTIVLLLCSRTPIASRASTSVHSDSHAHSRAARRARAYANP